MTDRSGDDEAGDEIVVECELDAPPEKVWRALTEPELLAAWLPEDAMPCDAAVERRVLLADPPRRLELGWRAGDEFDSVVTVELERLADERTRFRLVHDRFRRLGANGAAANGNTPPLAMAA